MDARPLGTDSGLLPEQLAELVKTPIGRRRLLQLGGAGGLALALRQALPAFAAEQTRDPVHQQHRPQATGRDVRDVYLGLGKLPSFERILLRMGSRDIAFMPLTTLQQRMLATQGTLFALMDRTRITHVARKVSLPRSGPIDLLVLGQRPGSSRVGIIAQRVYTPRWAAVAVAERRIQRTGSVAAAVHKAGWIKTLGLPTSALNALTANDLAELDVLLEDTSTAMAFVYKHPEIMNLDAESSATTNSVLSSLPEVEAFAAAISQVARTDYPYWFQNILNPDGSQAYVMQTAADQPGYGQPIPDPDTGLPVPSQQLVLNQTLMPPFGDAVKASINAIKDTTDLQGSSWELTPTPAPQPQNASTLLRTNAPLNVALSRQGWNWGVKVEADPIDPSTRKINLRIYNNWERSLAVHVQYFADKNTQLAVDNHDQIKSATDYSWRSTANSEYLTYVSDMPTMYGLPWAIDTNYSSTTIQLPDNAVSARLLVCGPGSRSNASQWAPFFTIAPYTGKGYPDECQWPLNLTHLFDIGVPAILLAADAAVANGTAVGSLQTALKVAATASKTAVVNSLDGWEKLGGPLGEYFNNKNSQNVDFQSSLGAMGALLPLVIWGSDGSFELYWQAGAALTVMVLQFALVKTIPILGEVFSAIAAVGDIIQIATTAAEQAAAPWVIDTDVRVTYPATIRVQKDPKDAVWPRGAGGSKWSLSAIADGTSTNNPVTGAIPDGQSADIVVDLPAVPVSRTLQYTLSVTDANGNLIGQGSSAVLPNNDLNALPTAATFPIQEIMKPITAQTTFVRQDTLLYNTSLPGYSWASNVAVPTTITNKPADLLELDSVSVGTVSGMVGAIWRSNDSNKSYWVRNVPDVQNGSSVKLQFAGPYTRKPLMVYDRLSSDMVNGNNFFLEPAGDNGYLVRKLKLSPDGGTLGWTPNQAWGQFQQNLVAVTLHPNNFLIGVNSINGKIHKLPIPLTPTADNNYPFQSQAYAGPASIGSTRPGLTQTPIGVAVTLTGVVVVLEAGANRLQAFDVDGNPVAYFGADPNNLSYFAPLAGNASDTRLSLGVDGAGWFYVLSYSGSGANPSDYHVDVYRPDGTFIVSPHGVNAASFDVDYWRNLFTLDYAALGTTSGGAYVDPAVGRIEPSTSIWVPSNPASGTRS